MKDREEWIKTLIGLGIGTCASALVGLFMFWPMGVSVFGLGGIDSATVVGSFMILGGVTLLAYSVLWFFEERDIPQSLISFTIGFGFLFAGFGNIRDAKRIPEIEKLEQTTESLEAKRERIVYRVEIPLGGAIRTYTATNLKLEGTSVSFRDSATGNTVILQNAIVTKIRDSLNQGGK